MSDTAPIGLEEAIHMLRTLSDAELVARGFSVEGTFDEIDDPVLKNPLGETVPAWKEGYPYDEKMSRDEYEALKRPLQIELLKAQEWIKDGGQRLAVLFEGRDAAGKGGTIRRFLEHLNPRGVHNVALAAPSERERGQWYFQRYVEHLPAAGEIVLFDRSWYNRAVVERVMGFCTPEEYDDFMIAVPEFERMLTRAGLILVKLWFSVSRWEQIARFAIRRIDPVRQWKLSSTDLESLDRWEDYTRAKALMFERTHSEYAPWTVVNSNDKKRGRLAAMQHVLSRLNYPNKDTAAVGAPDPLIVGPPDAFGDERNLAIQ